MHAVMVDVSKVGTDPMTSWSAEHNTVSTGILKGTKAEVLAGDVFGDSTRAINIPVNGVVGSLLRDFSGFLEGIKITEQFTVEDRKEALDRHIEIRDSMVDSRPDAHVAPAYVMVDGKRTRNLEGLKYKARPLNGIWATAPYLHNGSVPDLWSLLLKPEKRPERFWVGSHSFDPKKVGFVSNKGKNEFRARDSAKKIIPGNSNLGHTYGTSLSEEDKWALIEYMKSM